MPSRCSTPGIPSTDRPRISMPIYEAVIGTDDDFLDTSHKLAWGSGFVKVVRSYSTNSSGRDDARLTIVACSEQHQLGRPSPGSTRRNAACLRPLLQVSGWRGGPHHRWTNSHGMQRGERFVRRHPVRRVRNDQRTGSTWWWSTRRGLHTGQRRGRYTMWSMSTTVVGTRRARAPR